MAARSLMDDHGIHSESFIQWVWETLRFDTQNLRTTENHPITLIDPGQLNTSDGPDFTQAHIIIDEMEWHGDIELHLKESEWYQHHHHQDSNYNNVILHVFVIPGNPARRSDGTQPARLNLSPHLPDRIRQLTSTFTAPDHLACHSLLPHIPESALRDQFRKAHREYFEQKVDDLLKFYPSSLPLDEAWRQMTLTALFDGLGIAHNREPMRRLLSQLALDYSGQNTYDPEELRKRALRISGIRTDSPELNWRHKGSRPNNHPTVRIQQAAWLVPYFISQPLKCFLSTTPKQFWTDWFDQLPSSLQVGPQRQKILFGTVFLPSLYLLGALGASHSLKQRSFENWQKLRAPLPRSLLRPLEASSIDQEYYRHRLGSIYQLRHYCRQHRCHQCEVLKKSLGA